MNNPSTISNTASEKLGIGGTCAICNATKIDFGDFLIEGMTRGEIWDTITPLAAQRGWQVRPKTDGGIELVCPACIEKIEKPGTAELPFFKADEVCPMCTQPDPSMHFCNGREKCPAIIMADHVHKTCKRCGFGWITATAAESASPRDERNMDLPFFILCILMFVAIAALFVCVHLLQMGKR